MINQIFVFGSNLAGRHGAGAAKYAMQHWGAEYGVGVGLTGRAYALPTKDINIQTLSWEDIITHLLDFVQCAKNMNDHQFILTPIGTGLAGYSKQLLMDTLFEIGLPDNVVLHSSFVNDWKEK